jgi:hypothetical protein
MPEQTSPSDKTVEADEAEAKSGHDADRPPTADEEAAADRALSDPDLTGDQAEVAEHYHEMTEKGVAEKGEGRIS